jgi:MtN3 and saliva related transmembrane protein
MSLSFWPLVGIGAAVLTSTSFIPQTITRWRHPEHSRVSYATLVIFMLGSLLWAAYGIHLRDAIIIGANAFILTNLLFLALLQWWQERNRR